MNFKRQLREPLAINLTPLIDVVFLLLIFFMVSTSFTELTELVVNLPEAAGTPPGREQSLELVISANSDMYLNGIPVLPEAKSLEALIIEKVGSRRNIPFSIVADTDTRHGMVVMSMDTVSQLGFERLSISARAPSGGG